ncbi:MAG: hypothetical protein P8181_00120, partial [bacterium]
MKHSLLVILMLCAAIPVQAERSARTIDFLDVLGVEVNAAGPLLVRMDTARNRLIVANTLSSSLTFIGCSDHSVTNVPLGGRALQHLKSESMTFNHRTGDVYLIGAKCLVIVDPDNVRATTIPTGVQFESVAVDEDTGGAVVAGRESKDLGLYKAGAKKLRMIEWLNTSEALINLNQTPPPPIRKVIVDNSLDQVIAVDGGTSTLFLYEAKSMELLNSRTLALAPGGRWHLAGFNEREHTLYLVTETDKRRVIQAARIDIAGENDVVVSLPEYTEGVGITYNPKREEVYIAYDNHPSVHVVTFDDGGSVDEIEIPAYGNDAAVIDVDNDVLYVASWAHGEIDVVDLMTRSLQKRIEGLGIIPHMFTMAFNPRSGFVYFPKGASAVNGTFGAAVTALDPASEQTMKIHTGWAPIDLVELPSRESFFVFNN